MEFEQDIFKYEIFENEVCDYCNPNHREELRKLTNHLLDGHNMWIGGYTKEKHKQLDDIREGYQVDKRKRCFCLCDIKGVYICKKHLIELAERMG